MNGEGPNSLALPKQKPGFIFQVAYKKDLGLFDLNKVASRNLGEWEKTEPMACPQIHKYDYSSQMLTELSNLTSDPGGKKY